MTLRTEGCDIDRSQPGRTESYFIRIRGNIDFRSFFTYSSALMSSGFEIRCPIHGFIYREPYECDIIDTKVYQRLRNLHQLALEYLVYPGATHTRFDHSLGAFHIASGLGYALFPERQTDRRLVRLAALLHDIGHGPFSHVAEPILQRHSAKEKFAGKQESKIHELISAQIILGNQELREHMSDRERAQIVGLLDGTFGHNHLHEIVSGPLDADKQDYLLRDSYFTGVKYGIYDQERLKNTLRLHEDNDDVVLAISIDGIHALEQFVLAKYYMTTQVYRHKIRLITDNMIERAISLGIEQDGIGWLKDLYSYDGSDDYITEYLQWHDERLVNEILRENDTYAKDLFLRLRERRLFKCIFEADQNDFADPVTRSFVFAGSRDFYKPLEKQIAKQFGFDENHIIAYTITFNSATKTESEVPVLHRSKTTVFHDESALFKSADQKIREQHFHVYAPAEYGGDEKQKKKKYREYKDAILKMLEELANPQQKLAIN